MYYRVNLNAMRAAFECNLNKPHEISRYIDQWSIYADVSSSTMVKTTARTTAIFTTRNGQLKTRLSPWTEASPRSWSISQTEQASTPAPRDCRSTHAWGLWSEGSVLKTRYNTYLVIKNTFSILSEKITRFWWLVSSMCRWTLMKTEQTFGWCTARMGRESALLGRSRAPLLHEDRRISAQTGKWIQTI